MINSKKEDKIKHKPFDRYFTKTKKLDAFYKVGFVPFSRKCLTNPKMRHELDEETSESGKLQSLQKKYIECTRKTKQLGFNKVFNARLPKTQKLMIKSSMEERVEELINKNKAFSCPGFCVCMGTLIYNSKKKVAQKEITRRKTSHKRKKMEKVASTEIRNQK